MVGMEWVMDSLGPKRGIGSVVMVLSISSNILSLLGPDLVSQFNMELPQL